jgi:hypothetical protein
LNWSQTGERKIFRPDFVTEAEEKVKIIQNNIKASQSRQKSYADKRRKPIQFEVGDLYTCEYLLLEVFNDSVSKANSLLAMLALLKSLKFVGL